MKTNEELLSCFTKKYSKGSLTTFNFMKNTAHVYLAFAFNIEKAILKYCSREVLELVQKGNGNLAIRLKMFPISTPFLECRMYTQSTLFVDSAVHCMRYLVQYEGSRQWWSPLFSTS